MSNLSINILLIRTTLNYFWSSVVGVVKVDYFDFSCKKLDLYTMTLLSRAIYKKAKVESQR